MTLALVRDLRDHQRLMTEEEIADFETDLLAEFVLAMKTGTGLSGIGRTIHSYPTFSEIARKVADQRQKTRLTPIAKKIFGFFYAFNRR